MPQVRDITVHVTDKQGNDLEEWGVQHIKRHNHGERVSVYIQAITDMPFRVSVVPDRRRLFPNVVTSPYSETAFEQDKSHGGPHIGAANHQVEVSDVNRMSRLGLTRHNQRGRRDDFGEHSLNIDHGIGRRHFKTTPQSSIQRKKSYHEASASRYSFIATLYLDGRSTPERKIVVYTDPTDRDFSPPDGKVFFNHRWVKAKSGGIQEHAWIFKEKSIETVFEQMTIAGYSDDFDDDDDDDGLRKAMASTTLQSSKDIDGQSNKLGQILVVMHRVVLKEKRYESNFLPKHTEGEDEDIDMSRLNKELTHATGLLYKGSLPTNAMRVVEYELYNREEGPYATFQFLYRSQRQLLKYNFPGYPPPATVPARPARLLNSRMADQTPLSILRSKQQDSQKAKRDLKTYEEKVKNKTFKSEQGSMPDVELEFRDQSKDRSEVLVMIPQSGPPRSRLSTIAEHKKTGTQLNGSTATTSGKTDHKPERHPQRYPMISKGRTPPRSLSLEIEKAPSSNDPSQGLSQSIITISTDNPFPCPELSTNATRRDRRSEHALESYTSKPSAKASALNSCKAMDPPSSSTSPPAFTNEHQTSTPAASDKDNLHYRPYLATYPNESDVDDECASLATESDLETCASHDKDYEYTANPEQDMDEGYDSLRSKLGDLNIRKRSRALSEKGEDVGAVRDGEGDGGAKVVSENGGDGDQDVRKIDGTSEEDAGRPKKVRFLDVGHT